MGGFPLALQHPLFSSADRNGSGNEAGLEGSNGEDGSDSKDHDSKLCSRGHWRPEEDVKLRELVARHGPQNWNLIALKLHGRSGV
ncbi:Transcription factor MYB44 [Apostasia shenzhenica]|uniref:Transcription factor MYB44 n=1 Tax=Apostasia shenzhenica TaxID=1088818 RepID=A0A2I0B203_9ASPA|nr:Transcription factor MYB44 [Apostasia shenzhenica]